MEYINYVLVYEDPKYNNKENDSHEERLESLRRRFVIGMRKENLSVQEERVGKHMFIKVSCPLERMYKEAEAFRVELPLLGLVIQNPEQQQEAMIERKMKKLFSETKRTKNSVCAPFQKDCIELFTDSDHPNECILWSSIRCLLVYNILSNINISRHNDNDELPEKIGLSYLLMMRAFKDGFTLHDPSIIEPVSLSEIRRRVEDLRDETPPTDLRRELSRKWGGPCSRQPIHEIRDYFGEKIAFYFAWVSTLMASLWIPAILGVGVFAYGLTERLENVEAKGMIYVIEIVKQSSDNNLTPGFAAIICLWGTIFMEVWKRRQISLARQWYVDNFDNVEPDRPQFYGTKGHINQFTKQFILHYPFQKRILKYTVSLSVLLFMVMLVFISVTSVILYRVYMTISFCTEGDNVCDLLHGTILATFYNTLSIMLLGRIYEYIAEKLTNWENHQTLSAHNDALIIKLFAFQFANTYASLFYTAFFRRDFGTGILGLSEKYVDNCGHKDNDNCMSLLSFQLLILMIVKPFPKFAKDVLLPLFKKCLRHFRFNEIDDITTDEGISKQNYLMREYQKPAAEDFRLGEFTEKMIQYGYLVMFAASFPLAPALALLFNMIDFKIDSRRLLNWNRRPIPYRDNDIGIWFNIINFINICGVISNAFLIAFTSEIGRGFSLYMQFAFVIGFEHFIFVMKFLLTLIIPDVPTWVQNSIKKERYLVSYLMSRLKFNPQYGEGMQRRKMVIPEETAECGDIPLEIRNCHPNGIPKSRWSC
ncbi:anoctamin-8-like [Uloborus diversus]|uniref:anoctamin-8-like n=1 Tax=Uloborus diversus TaxID=327109 RepID=UPI00240A363E|nr:anoctamin-8-like [Uloborus diversus]